MKHAVQLYKSTPASRDDQVSYYGLGAATAFCLDVRLRAIGSSWQPCCESSGATMAAVATAISDATSWIPSAVTVDLADSLPQWLDQPDSLPLMETASLSKA